MCVVSMVSDHYRDKWSDPHRWDLWPLTPVQPVITPVRPLTNEEIVKRAIELTRVAAEKEQEFNDKIKKEGAPVVSVKEDDNFEIESLRNTVKSLQNELNDFKKEVLEMKELLIKAKQYDIDNKEPDCEMDDNGSFIKANC